MSENRPSASELSEESDDRNHGPQPIADLLTRHGIKSHDLVAASTEQITHKMVTRACKGRRLTNNVQSKLQRALNKLASANYRLADLFNY